MISNLSYKSSDVYILLVNDEGYIVEISENFKLKYMQKCDEEFLESKINLIDIFDLSEPNINGTIESN